MSVSAVIPTFDRSAVLVRAVESVLAQTLPVDEVIVVDDGSSDETRAVIAERFPDVRLESIAHAGVSAARNRGIALATGDWIAFLDSDDEWLPRRLERQMEALDEAPGHRIVHCEEVWIRNGRRVNARRHHRKSGGRIFERCLPLCVISPSAVLLERTLIEAHGGFDESLPACEDYDLWLRLCAEEPVLFVEEPLIVKYGGHADQLSRTTWGLDRFRIEALEKALANPALDAAQREAVLAELERKLEIFVAGARKRDPQVAARWERRRDNWTVPA